MVVSQFLQKANSFYDKLNIFYIRAFHVDECLLCSYSLRTSVCVWEREKGGLWTCTWTSSGGCGWEFSPSPWLFKAALIRNDTYCVNSGPAKRLGRHGAVSLCYPIFHSARTRNVIIWWLLRRLYEIMGTYNSAKSSLANSFLFVFMFSLPVTVM